MKQRLLCTFGILFALFFSVNAQQRGRQRPSPKLSFEYEDECGNPVEESMAWSLIEGKVVRVFGGDSFELLDNKGEHRIVKLVAIDTSSAKDVAWSLLSRLLLDQKVDVLVNPSDDKGRTLVGVVQLSMKDVNRELLAVGAARYKEPAAYTVSGYTACVYRIVEKKAREARKGIWKRASPPG